MKPHMQIALGVVALTAGLLKSPALAAALAEVQSPYTAGYAVGVGALVLLLSLAGSRLIGRGIYRLGMRRAVPPALPNSSFKPKPLRGSA